MSTATGPRQRQGAGRLVRNVGRVIDAEWTNYRRTWRGSVFSAFLGPLLYLGAIGFGLGSLIESDGAGLGTTRAGEAIDYVAFLAPGLVAATAMQVGSGEAIFGTMGRVEWRKLWQTAVSTPLMPADLALAHVVWIAIRAALAALAYALVTVAFGILPVLDALAVVPPAVLGGVALGTVLSAWLVRVPDPQVTNAAQRFVVIPMFLFGGVFFPVSQLPDWLGAVARATPLWHATVLARLVGLDVPTPWGVGAHLAVLVAYLVVGISLMLPLFRRRLLS